MHAAAPLSHGTEEGAVEGPRTQRSVYSVEVQRGGPEGCTPKGSALTGSTPSTRPMPPFRHSIDTWTPPGRASPPSPPRRQTAYRSWYGPRAPRPGRPSSHCRASWSTRFVAASAAEGRLRRVWTKRRTHCGRRFARPRQRASARPTWPAYRAGAERRCGSWLEIRNGADANGLGQPAPHSAGWNWVRSPSGERCSLAAAWTTRGNDAAVGVRAGVAGPVRAGRRHERGPAPPPPRCCTGRAGTWGRLCLGRSGLRSDYGSPHVDPPSVLPRY